MRNTQDPKLRKWLKAETKEIKIDIQEPNKIKYNNSGFTKKEIELMGEDIRFIHTGELSFSRIGENWVPNSIYVFYKKFQGNLKLCRKKGVEKGLVDLTGDGKQLLIMNKMYYDLFPLTCGRFLLIY